MSVRHSEYASMLKQRRRKVSLLHFLPLQNKQQHDGEQSSSMRATFFLLQRTEGLIVPQTAI